MGMVIGKEIALGALWLFAFASLLIAASHAVWGGVESSLDDDDETDRDRGRECGQMIDGMKTTKDTKGHEGS